MRSCIFGEREDIILLFIEFIRRHLIYRPLGMCVCACVFFFFFLRAVKRTFNDFSITYVTIVHHIVHH